MLSLPEQSKLLLKGFAPVFSERAFEWLKVSVVGAIAAPRKRTVSAALRVMGLCLSRFSFGTVFGGQLLGISGASPGLFV